MASKMMSERTAMMMAPASGMGMPMGMMGEGMMKMPTMSSGPMSAGSGMMMVPRCKMTMERCQGGMKMMCTSDDAMTLAMMQNLCGMMAGGMLSCCMMMNGMSMMTCNMAMCAVKCEMTKDGCMITCTSGDKACCDMVQACCDAMACMMKAGCACCMMMNGMPVCCGC